MAKKTELRERLNELVKEYNDKNQTACFKEAGKINKDIEQVLNEYTSLVRSECFDALLKTDSPMAAAAKQLTYETIRIRDTKEKDDDGNLTIPVRVIDDVCREIDILRLHKYSKDGIGADTKWQYYVEKLNFLMTSRIVQEINKDKKDDKEKIKLKEVNDSYLMNQISREIDMGKTPTSKTALLKQLNIVIKAMLGEEYKATSRHVAFLLETYAKGGHGKKALKVICSNHKALRQIMVRICHEILTDADFDAEYQVVKEKKNKESAKSKNADKVKTEIVEEKTK